MTDFLREMYAPDSDKKYQATKHAPSIRGGEAMTEPKPLWLLKEFLQANYPEIGIACIRNIITSVEDVRNNKEMIEKLHIIIQQQRDEIGKT